jgi:4-diphosphocytidyl-2-C-methyl-D-erythritol kinase
VKMDLRGDDFKRSIRAPAKLNLFLDVLGRRGDGFHDLETLMVPIRLADHLSLSPTRATSESEPGAIQLDVDHSWPVGAPAFSQKVPAGPDNLVVKALRLLQERSGRRLGARVRLLKRVPMAAGMGGGSSDAAAALRLANHAWQLNWKADRLTELAAQLGSDIPFFVSPGAAICRGRGEQVQRVRELSALHFVIVKPPVALGAGEVYTAYDSIKEQEAPTARGELKRWVAAMRRGAPGSLASWMHNGLQTAASALSPCVDKIRRAFSELDVIAHQLTGSGSAYFGVCRHAQHARRLASILRTQQLGLVYATRSCQ